MIDEEFTQHPFYGSRRLAAYLASTGNYVCRDKVRALMQKMGLQTVYAKPKLSARNPDHVVYPYLLRGVTIDRVDHVWSTDITYIRMRNGFLYLAAVIDWFSRYVPAWKLSNSLDGDFCREVVLEALQYGKPSIFNVDQGPQFTCREFVNMIKEHEISLSMDGKGRCMDNIFVERLWRTVKYEEVYLKDYEDGLDAHDSLSRYFMFYNNKRPHQSLGYMSPSKIYFGNDMTDKLGASPQTPGKTLSGR
jgi:putative transposase